MDNFIKALVEQLPFPYVVGGVLLVLLVLLGFLVWADQKNREVKLLWGAITLGPRSSANDDKIMRELLMSLENIGGEVKKLKNEGMSALHKLLDEERELRAIRTRTNTSVTQEVALTQSLDGLRQDSQRLEKGVIEKMNSVENQLKEVVNSIKDLKRT